METPQNLRFSPHAAQAEGAEWQGLRSGEAGGVDSAAKVVAQTCVAQTCFFPKVNVSLNAF